MAVRQISGTGGNYNAGTCWVQGLVPTNADIVIGTVSSGPVTVNVASVAQQLDLTNYRHFMTFSNTLTVSGTVSLGANMTMSGASSLIMNSSGSIISNGKTMSVPFQLAGTSMTYTLVGDLNIVPLFTCNGTTTTTINGATISVFNGYTQTTVTTVNGNASIYFKGGTWSSTLTTNALRLNVFMNGDNIWNTNVAYNTGTLKYLSGTLNATTNNNTLSSLSSTTFDTNGASMAINNLVFNASTTTITTATQLNVDGNLQIGSSVNTTTATGSTISIGGGLNLSSMSTGVITGNSVLLLRGTGTITSQTTTGQVQCPIIIDTLGTYTFSSASNATYRMQNFTYNKGNLAATGATAQFSAGNVILNQPFTFSNIQTGSTLTFSGPFGFICNNLALVTIGVTHSLASSVTYSVNSNFISRLATSASNVGFISSLPGTQSIFTLAPGAYQDIGFTDATDINSSLGQTIWTYKGDISNSSNWRPLLPPGTISS